MFAELALELHEVRRCLEVRIGLGDGEQAAERAGEDAFGLGALLGRAVLRGLGGGAGFGDGLERVALVAHVALHGFHEIGDEVGAALELHVDARPAFLRELTLTDEIVVRENAVARPPQRRCQE